MKRKRVILGLPAGIVVVALWALFRPELLFNDTRVDEKVPEVSAQPEMATVLARGGFRGLAHETRGTATIIEIGNGKRALRLTAFDLPPWNRAESDVRIRLPESLGSACLMRLT